PLHPYRADPAPHSFPTRRSSDLTGATPAVTVLGVVVNPLDGLDPLHHLVPVIRLYPQPCRCTKVDIQGMAVALIGQDSVVLLHQDRKSTRLNSSHVSISYAVFCL